MHGGAVPGRSELDGAFEAALTWKARSDVVGVPGTDSVAQPPEERRSNRDRRPKIRKTPRAVFPLMTAATAAPSGERRSAAVETAGLDTSDPDAGGGRSFRYQWEEEATILREEIRDVAAGGGVSYTHHQSVASATWVIDHHLGLIPNVVILDDSGQQMVAEIRFPSDQTCVVVHSAPYTGTAYLRP